MREFLTKASVALAITALGAFGWVAAERPEAFDRLFTIALILGLGVIAFHVSYMAVNISDGFDSLLAELREVKEHFDREHPDDGGLGSVANNFQASSVERRIDHGTKIKSQVGTSLMFCLLIVVYFAALYVIHVAFNPSDEASESPQIQAEP